MIDGGAPKQVKGFIKAMGKLSIKPKDIRLIVLTHGHWDHIGSAKEIKELTGAKIALHKEEKDWLEKSLKPLPPGVTAWGKIFVKIMAMFMPLVHIPSTKVDIVLGDGDFSLTEYGIQGKIMHTPGHSMGSVSVLLETGDAFVGDLAMNMLPLRLGPGLPILAEDMQKVRESWQLLLDAGAKTIYPAHGEPFSVDMIREALL
jgi:glyoxylase-like metal-dependent hydrolase (beta-lactamase superfamily II)